MAGATAARSVVVSKCLAARAAALRSAGVLVRFAPGDPPG